jgi:uncharacterized protein (TIGR02452 family)
MAISIHEMSNRRRASLIQDLTDKIGILNFAPAINPGGGFINGVQAQEPLTHDERRPTISRVT